MGGKGEAEDTPIVYPWNVRTQSECRKNGLRKPQLFEPFLCCGSDDTVAKCSAMPFPLSSSFSETFLHNPNTIRPAGRPTSVYQAIVSLNENVWKKIAEEVFATDPERLDPMMVLDEVRRTDTCSNLDSPVQVWIDKQGWYDVLVYNNELLRLDASTEKTTPQDRV